MTKRSQTHRSLHLRVQPALIRQAAVVGLALIPFSISCIVAYVAWTVLPWLEGWHMILTVLAWIAAFAAGTQLFWRLVDLLAR